MSLLLCCAGSSNAGGEGSGNDTVAAKGSVHAIHSSSRSILVKMYVDGSGSMDARRAELRYLVSYAAKEFERFTPAQVDWEYYITTGEGAPPQAISTSPTDFYNQIASGQIEFSGLSPIAGMIEHTLSGLNDYSTVVMLVTDYESTEGDFREKKQLIEHQIVRVIKQGFQLKVVYARSEKLTLLIFGDQNAVSELLPPIYYSRFFREALQDQGAKWVDFSSGGLRYYVDGVAEGSGTVLNDNTLCETEADSYSGMLGVEVALEAYGIVESILRSMEGGMRDVQDWDSVAVEPISPSPQHSPDGVRHYPNYRLIFFMEGGVDYDESFTFRFCGRDIFTECRQLDLAKEDSFVEGLCRIFYETKLVRDECPFTITINFRESCEEESEE